MTPEEQIIQLRNELEEFKSLYYKDNFSALEIIRKQQQLADGINFEVGSSDGTKIGTATSQKLSVYGETPVVQAGAISSPDADVDELKAAVDALRIALQNFGITA